MFTVPTATLAGTGVGEALDCGAGPTPLTSPGHRTRRHLGTVTDDLLVRFARCYESVYTIDGMSGPALHAVVEAGTRPSELWFEPPVEP